MSLDRDVRKYAVPVRGTIWGMNYDDRTERDIGGISSVPVAFSDYHDFFPGFHTINPGAAYPPQIGASKICPIRVLKPHYGGLAECYADIRITVASGDNDLTLKLAVGRMNSDYSRVMNYSDEELDSSWRKIRGSDTPLSVSSGVIAADLIDLLPALPEYGAPDYSDDAFVLILIFNKTPSLAGSFNFNYLNIHTSVTGVV